MENVVIERLTKYEPNDAAGIGRLMPQLASEFTNQPIDKTWLEQVIASPYHEQLVARQGDNIVGAATLSIVMGAGMKKRGHLEDFVTDENIRGQGIGGLLWDDMMRWCKENEIDLEFTSRPSREAAHAFYLKHGAIVRETTVFLAKPER